MIVIIEGSTHTINMIDIGMMKFPLDYYDKTKTANRIYASE